VSEYVGQKFQLRLIIYSEKWTLLKPLMWNPFISRQKTYMRTDCATDGIQANNFEALEVYCPPILCVGFISRIFMEISDLLC
jgi:hypothetical protein